MPRNCGCASASCTCLLTSSDGTVDITGSGASGNPYDLSAASTPLTGRLTVQDTPTVDLTLDGEGTATEPFVLSATSNLALGDLTDVDTSGGSAGDVVAQQPDGSFGMNPPSTAEPGVIMSDASLDGDGSASDPLSVHDYDRIAWLSGADNTPNEGNLRLGSPSMVGDYKLYVSRNQSGGSGSTAYDSQQDHYIGARVGTSLAGSPAVGPLGSGGLVMHAEDVNHLPNQTADLILYQTGHLARRHFDDPNTYASYVPFAMWCTRVCVTGDGSETAEVTVNFPVGYFTEVPTVTATLNNAIREPTGLYAARVEQLTDSSCIVVLQRVDGGTFSVEMCIGVQVMQMDPPSS